MSARSIRHAPRAFTSHEIAGSFCDVCHTSGARYSASDEQTLCKTHRAQLRKRVIKCANGNRIGFITTITKTKSLGFEPKNLERAS